ncbi:MAG: rhodanese-like domain-containing protein [Pseudomonadota bacterium]
MKRTYSLILILVPMLLLISTTVKSDEEFPVRSLYPKVSPIELEELYNRLDEVVVFDVRSSYEYETLHIKGSKHLALNDREFEEKLKQLRADTDKPFVFYCNGHTCKKSYKATQKAMRERIANVIVFDAGIFDWTKAYPDEAVLLGQTPVNPSDLLDKEKLAAHMLEPEAFGRLVHQNSIVLDIRDNLQKAAISLFPMKQHSVPLDNNSLKTYVDQAKQENKTLLIYDAVGKQVRWLQYYLEAQGISSYYFMKGGAKAFLKY